MYVDEINIGPMKSNYGSQGNFFLGKMSELNIFSNIFSEDELLSITRNCEKIENGTYIFEWSKLKKSDIRIPENSLIETKERSINEFCSIRAKKRIEIIPFPVDTKTANKACTAWGGRMFLPESMEDIKKMKMITDK